MLLNAFSSCAQNYFSHQYVLYKIKKSNSFTPSSMIKIFDGFILCLNDILEWFQDVGFEFCMKFPIF